MTPEQAQVAGREQAKLVVSGMTPEEQQDWKAGLRMIRPLGYQGWRAAFAQHEEKDPALRLLVERVRQGGADPEEFFRGMFDFFTEFSRR